MKDLEIQEQAEKIASKRPKLEHLDEFAFDNRGVNQIAYDNYALGFIQGAKWVQEQDKAESKAVELLRKLVALKAYKDKKGKDLYYKTNQPQAWQDAKEFLTKMPLPQPPKTK